MTYLLTALISALSMLALYHATLRELERALTSEEPPRGILATLTRICASTPRSRRVLTLIQRLKQSDADHQTRYKILANNVPAAVVLHEANGTILWCSSFTEVVTGFA